MSGRDLKSKLFYTPLEISEMFRREGDLKWVYRHATGKGFLSPHACRFGRTILFQRDGIDRLVEQKGA